MFTVILVIYENGIRKEQYLYDNENLSIIEDYVKHLNSTKEKDLHLYTYHIHSQKYNDINKKAEEHFWLQYKE
jgi:hypothetical protein